MYCKYGKKYVYLIMTFEWDEHKNQLNIQKHDLTFEEAQEAFFDRK